MSFWKRSDQRLPEIEKSDRLCKERDALLLTFPGVVKRYNAADIPVLAAAREYSAIVLTQNPEKILEFRQVLQRAKMERDDIKYRFQRKLDELNGEIEAINAGLINEKATEWREGLAQLRDKKIIEKVSTRETIEPGKMITYRSNFRTVAATKEKILEAISALREMRHSPLSAVQGFIKKVEEEASGIDFDALKEEPEVTEKAFEQLCSRPEVKVYKTGVTYTLFGDQIIKTFDAIK